MQLIRKKFNRKLRCSQNLNLQKFFYFRPNFHFLRYFKYSSKNRKFCWKSKLFWKNWTFGEMVKVLLTSNCQIFDKVRTSTNTKEKVQNQKPYSSLKSKICFFLKMLKNNLTMCDSTLASVQLNNRDWFRSIK